MRPIHQTLGGLGAADTDAYALAQTTAGAAYLTLAGALVNADGIGVAPGPQFVTLTSVANLSAITFTVVGRDEVGTPVSEVITGPNATTVTGTVGMKEVDSIYASAAVGTNVEAGIAQAGAYAPIPLDQYLNAYEVSMAIDGILTSTISVTVRYTFDDIWNTDREDLQWTNHSDLTAIVADVGIGTLISPVSAVQAVVNSGDGNAILHVQQAGVQ